MDASASCPACGQRNALIALGVRWDHPHHWRFWISALMHLYLCAECDALIEVRNATAVRGTAPEPEPDGRIVASRG
jgi:DNA-directed RNA polymerase subunit RPC12/RpoP